MKGITFVHWGDLNEAISEVERIYEEGFVMMGRMTELPFMLHVHFITICLGSHRD